MKQYVVGLAFSQNSRDLVLIEKVSKPNEEWQAGLLNGVGGKVEYQEVHANAMVREFEEETSVHVPELLWHHYATYLGKTHLIHYFRAFTDRIRDCKTVTPEKVMRVSPAQLPTNLVPNMNFFIPMALQANAFTKPAIIQTW